MEMKNKTRILYILDTLMTGKSLLSSDIARMVSGASGEETKVLVVDRLMTKLSNTWTFQIGHFIYKNKTPQGYEYSLVPEILNLTPEETYDLTRQTEKDRFTLEMALKKIPELKRYVKKAINPAVKQAVDKKVAIKKPAKKKVSPQKKTSIQNPKVNVEKSVFKIEPEVHEPVVQDVQSQGLFSIFLNEIERIGGLRVNFHLKVKLQKVGDTLRSLRKK